MPKRGRQPSERYDDPNVRRVLIGAFRRGLPASAVAALAGVHPVTLAKWVKQGTDDMLGERDTSLARLVIETSQAEARHMDEALKHVTKAGKYEWRASAWLLERRHGFSSTTKIDAEIRTGGDVGGIRVDVDLSGRSIEELRAIAYGDRGDIDGDDVNDKS